MFFFFFFNLLNGKRDAAVVLDLLKNSTSVSKIDSFMRFPMLF